MDGSDFHLATPGLLLTADLVPWDTEVFGFPVAQVQQIRIDDAPCAHRDWLQFRAWLAVHDVQIVSCRLPIDQLRESIFLEAEGFRFIEVVLHPNQENLGGIDIPPDTLTILPAGPDDLPLLTSIAERVFRHERYHVDPRLDPRFGHRRYGRWVRTSLDHPSQRLLKVLDGSRLVAFFVVEHKSAGEVYWHLNAIVPDCQGQGYGWRVWRAMLLRHQQEGALSVRTTISVRNTAVQNLYARLGFRFMPPEMTFHWLRSDE